MLPGKVVLPRLQFFLPGRDDLAMPAPIEGLLTQHVALGQAVVKGQSLATIESPLSEKHAVIRARTNGFIHDLNVRAKVNAGEDVVGVIGVDAFTGCRTKPWRNSMEKRTNHSSGTISTRESGLYGVGDLCWRPGPASTPALGPPGQPRSSERSRRAHRRFGRQRGLPVHRGGKTSHRPKKSSTNQRTP
jgi:hypothetical protein